jgi:hypothetical protein
MNSGDTYTDLRKNGLAMTFAAFEEAFEEHQALAESQAEEAQIRADDAADYAQSAIDAADEARDAAAVALDEVRVLKDTFETWIEDIKRTLGIITDDEEEDDGETTLTQ